jgi:septal ring factor EnvC (AmiA/AmiB activator)
LKNIFFHTVECFIQVNKLEEKLKIARTDAENAKRELKNELEGRRIVDRKLKTLEKDNKELRNKLSSLRVKLGVANANYNVGRHETEELRKNHQENQIQIARYVMSVFSFHVIS